MGLSDFFKKGVEKPAPEVKKTEPIKPQIKPEIIPPVAAAPVTYTVKSGDSLSLIAKHQYGDAKKWNTIFEANKSQIKDPDKIFPGMVLTIPKI